MKIDKYGVLFTVHESDVDNGTVTIPKGVVEINENAFVHVGSILKEVEIPYGVEIIGDNAFFDCELLKNITIPNSVTVIGNSAFYQCFSLDKIIIPASIEKIYGDAFSRCDNLNTVIIKNENVQFIDTPVFPEHTNIVYEKAITLPQNEGPDFKLNDLVIDNEGRRGRCMGYDPDTNKYQVLFVDAENISADGWFSAEQLAPYVLKNEPKSEKISSVDDLISQATAMSEHFKKFADDLSKFRDGLDMTD